MSYFFYSLTTCLTSSFPTDSHPVFTEVNSAVYISWRRADLARAEEILSCEIERGSSPLHYHVANRALIRARLRQWDGALDDAQTSLLVKPSLVALIAKGFSQSGKGCHQAATETLDAALEACDLEEKDIVGMIKAITFFDAGHRDEGLRHICNLVIGSARAKQHGVFIQTKMYALLAADAMNNQEFMRATLLLGQARSLCPSGQYPELDTLTLVSGWVFSGLRLAVYQQLCTAFEAAERTQDVLATIREMEDVFKDEIKLRNELNQWITGFKCRCVEALEFQGDRALKNEGYESAIAQYSEALTLNPLRVSLFIKRSEARASLSLWEAALKDADEAIRLNPSSPWGYERQHAALHGLKRYDDAIHALTATISSLEGSTEPEIQRLRSNYISPSETMETIFEVFTDFVRNSPFRLIDTTSGRLCNAEKRREIFKQDPVFQELVSSMTTQTHRERIDIVTRRYFRYVMLSHRWEVKELELGDVFDKSIYELDASPAATKLQRFCQLARDAQFRWAWSDTCCIDKDKDVEFERSINSMFHWYRCSSATIVYLAGVPPLMVPGALGKSIWMTRGWTLQELLSPPVIRFYYEDWTPYLNNASLNHKESADIMEEIEGATGVAAHDLIAFRPGPEDIRVKLRLASTRETTVPVDMAYGLFGIFGVTMPVIHGETQQNALGRLFQEIVARSGDIECLAWVGRSSEFNSAFPSHIRVYEHPSGTVPCIDGEELEQRAAEMRRAWTHEQEEQAGQFYRGLEVLPQAHCANQRLYLPCIVFRVTMLERIKRADDDVRRVYRASTSALEDTEIHTEERLSLKVQAQGAEEFVLVCPWIYELSDAFPDDHGRRHPASGESLSDSDSEPESEEEKRTSVMRTHPRLSPSGSAPTDETPLRASRLVVRFRQPLGAFLLLSQGRRQFKRIATDHEIMIRVREGISLADMDLRTLEVI
ncbi:hypothetical protein JVU11DRAFT_8639 [Chiua virens]|nr:hypothetical protein JVU11DRAFT_8639 [Chiua virens]